MMLSWCYVMTFALMVAAFPVMLILIGLTKLENSEEEDDVEGE